MQNRTIIIRTASYRRALERLNARGLRLIANRHISMTHSEWTVAAPRRIGR